MSESFINSLSGAVKSVLISTEELTHEVIDLVSPYKEEDSSQGLANSSKPEQAPQRSSSNNFADGFLDGAEKILTLADSALTRSINGAAGRLNAFWQGDSSAALQKTALPSSSSSNETKSIPGIFSDDSETAAEAQLAGLFGLVALVLLKPGPSLSGMRFLLTNRPSVRAARVEQFRDSLLAPANRITQTGNLDEISSNARALIVLENISALKKTLGVELLTALLFPELSSPPNSLGVGEAMDGLLPADLLRSQVRELARDRGLILSEEEVMDISDQVSRAIHPGRVELFSMNFEIASKLIPLALKHSRDAALDSLLHGLVAYESLYYSLHGSKEDSLLADILKPEVAVINLEGVDISGEARSKLREAARRVLLAQLDAGRVSLDMVDNMLVPNGVTQYSQKQMSGSRLASSLDEAISDQNFTRFQDLLREAINSKLNKLSLIARLCGSFSDLVNTVDAGISDHNPEKAKIMRVLKSVIGQPNAHFFEDEARKVRLTLLLADLSSHYSESEIAERVERIISHCTLMQLGSRDHEDFEGLRERIRSHLSKAGDTLSFVVDTEKNPFKFELSGPSLSALQKYAESTMSVRSGLPVVSFGTGIRFKLESLNVTETR